MCGVFGIYNDKDASWKSYFGLIALQHRGHESAGIAVSADNRINLYTDRGLVQTIFNDRILEALGGDAAIGHVRYSTVAGSDFIQPCKAEEPFEIALGHNGQINFGPEYDEKFKGCSANDSERLLRLISTSKGHTIEDMVEEALTGIIDTKGSYALVVLGQGKLIGARDPTGYRPLSLLKREDGSYILASESCAFDVFEPRIIGTEKDSEFIRDIEPGEIVIIDEGGLRSRHLPEREHSFCIFELIYFARPDSNVYGKNVASVRRAWGGLLAEEHPVDADIVFPVPDSGNEAALGYSQGSGIPLDPYILIRNHSIGRTFILPGQIQREIGVKSKLNPNKHFLKGKRGIVVDDSIVRATTIPKINSRLRDAGILEIHTRICSPPYCSPCYYGIDTPKKEGLAAATKSIDEIREMIGADSLGYLSLDGMVGLNELKGLHFCTECFGGCFRCSTNVTP